MRSPGVSRPHRWDQSAERTVPRRGQLAPQKPLALRKALAVGGPLAEPAPSSNERHFILKDKFVKRLRMLTRVLSSLAILVVADHFQPVDHFAVERFLNGNMRHGRRGCAAVPMLLA